MEDEVFLEKANGWLFKHKGIIFFQTEFDREYRRVGCEYTRDMDKLIPIRLRLNDNEETMTLHEWCKEKLKGYWVYWNETMVYLTDEEDVWEFKLVWS